MTFDNKYFSAINKCKMLKYTDNKPMNHFYNLQNIRIDRAIAICETLSKVYGCTEKEVFIDLLKQIEGKPLQPLKRNKNETDENKDR